MNKIPETWEAEDENKEVKKQSPQILCNDAFGTDAPDEVVDLISEYHERITDLVYDYVVDCREKNVEYLSSLGFLLSRVQVAFTLAHASENEEGNPPFSAK